jgi:uncharacterized protein YlxW (UPF0749 family)
MNLERNRSYYVPGRLSPGSLFLAVALFLMLDILVYRSATILFRDVPQAKTQEIELKSKMTELERRLGDVEKSANDLKSEVEAARNAVSAVKQNLEGIEKRTTRLEQIRTNIAPPKSR